MDKIRKIFMILDIFIVIFSLSALLCTITDEASDWLLLLTFLGVVLFGIGIGMRRKKQWDEADEALREELKQWEAYTHKNMAEFNSWSKSMLLITIIIMILLLVISEKIKKYL